MASNFRLPRIILKNLPDAVTIAESSMATTTIRVVTLSVVRVVAINLFRAGVWMMAWTKETTMAKKEESRRPLRGRGFLIERSRTRGGLG